jgi:hypothetical protein
MCLLYSAILMVMIRGGRQVYSIIRVHFRRLVDYDPNTFCCLLFRSVR